MAATVITGTRATAASAGILSNARVVDMSDVIHLLDPNEAPLTAITMKLRTVSSVNSKVEWMEDDYIPSADLTSGAVGTTGVTVGVDNVAYFRVGDVVQVVGTGEILYVSAVDTTSDLTVTRTVGATAAGTIATNSVLVIIGNANRENSTKRVIKTAKKTAQYNYCQIFRWEFGSSGTLQSSELYGGDDLSYQQQKAAKEFRIQMEKNYLFGERHDIGTGESALGSTAATPTRFCGGILEKISSNVTVVSTITVAEMETFLRSGFRYGPARKMLFASREIVSFLSIIADNKIQTRPMDDSFPLALTEYVSPHGKCYIVTHNQLTDYAVAAGLSSDTASALNNDAYHGWAALLDLDAIFHRPLKGRNTMLRTNIQANDQDGRIDGYLAECCPQLIQEKNHSMWQGATGGAFSA